MTKRAAMMLVFATSVASAQPPSMVELAPPRKTPFDRGRFGLGLGAGSTSAFGQRYYFVAGRAGYFVLDGVELELGGVVQWGDGPSIGRVTPGVRYVVQPLVGHFPLIPYVGVFYSHWFVGGGDAYPDQDSIGTRGGVLYVSGSIVLGLGIAYEHVVSTCAMDCSAIYPDLTISIAL